MLKPVGELKFFMSLNGRDGLVGDVQVIRVHDTGKAADAVINEVTGRKTGQRRDFITHVTHSPIGIVLTAIDDTGQVGHQSPETIFALLQRSSGGLQFRYVTSNAQKTG